MGMSNEADILIVGDPSERFALDIRQKFRHWQVYTLTNPGSVYGRRFRRAYYTDGAESSKNFERVIEFLRANGEVRHLSTYVPETDAQALQDEALLRDIRRSRYPSS